MITITATIMMITCMYSNYGGNTKANGIAVAKITATTVTLMLLVVMVEAQRMMHVDALNQTA